MAANDDPKLEPAKRGVLVSRAPTPAERAVGGTAPSNKHVVRIPKIDYHLLDFDDAELDTIKAAELRAARVVALEQGSVRSRAEGENLLLRNWVLPIFATFSKLARNRAKEVKGTYSLHEVDSESREFLSLLTCLAGMNSPQEWFAGRRITRTEIQDEIEYSSEWKRHQKELLRLADVRANAVTEESRTESNADSETRKRRRDILKRYKVLNELSTMDDLARHLGMSKTAIEGIVRSDSTRYGPEKLASFLKKIDVKPEDW